MTSKSTSGEFEAGPEDEEDDVCEKGVFAQKRSIKVVPDNGSQARRRVECFPSMVDWWMCVLLWPEQIDDQIQIMVLYKFVLPVLGRSAVLFIFFEGGYPHQENILSASIGWIYTRFGWLRV